MLGDLARAMHLTPTVFYSLCLLVLLLVALAIGITLNRIFHKFAKKFQNTWGELIFALLECLPIPLLVLAALYTALEVLALPPQYERLGSKLVFALVVLVTFYFPGKVIILFLRRLGQRDPGRGRLTEPAALVIRTIFALLAIYTVLEGLSLRRKYQQLGSKVIHVLLVLVIFYFLVKVAVLFLRRLNQKDPGLARVTEPAAFFLRVLFGLLAMIIILENLGIHLTAVWTTLGVGSVAVALALQETLSNFFAGIYLLADRPLNPGDYIKMDSGQEGFVVHVGWRSTSLRTVPNNTVIVPNSTLAKAVITNYAMPEWRMSLAMQISVAYGTDPNHVERVLVEVAQEASRDGLEGLLSTPAPVARLIPGFGASSLDFSLIVQIRQFTDQYLIQSELRKRILERLDKEGIQMPFPTQTILLDKSVRDSLGGAEPKSQRDESAQLSAGQKSADS